MPLDKLNVLLEAFDEFPDPADRTDMLLSYADQFKDVPADVARRPFDKTLSGLPAPEIATVSTDIVERIFRRNISMGKGIGLMSMVEAVRALARRAAERGQSTKGEDRTGGTSD
jgi:sulfur transfer protein SufE